MHKFNIQLNKLFTGILAVNGIKVVCNTRIGSPETLDCLNSIPRGVMCASGTFGCCKTKDESDLSFISKILTLRPNKLIIYGKKDEIMLNQLDMFGVNYERFNDFYTCQRLYRSKSVSFKYVYCAGDKNGR